MSMTLLTPLVLVTTFAVVVALFAVMWLERRSETEARVATVAGVVLAIWAALACVLAARGFFVQPPAPSPPPVGINLLVVLAGLAAVLAASPSLRRLLTNQKNLIRLNLWRLVGIVFLLLAANHQVPALWALPAGIGDVIVGAAAPWVANGIDSPGGRRRAIVFNVFGIADLVVAIGLGTMTAPGPTQVFHTSPTSELLMQFPMALVPTFLVPLAFTLQVVSLWQLIGGSWASDRSRKPALSRS
jgi:hypothetical protein